MLQYSYDVFSFDGSEWKMERTFSTTQNDDALEFAKNLYAAPQIKGVRIVREIYDPENGGAGRRVMLNRIKSEATPSAA